MEPLSWGEIIIRILVDMMPTWIALVVMFVVSIYYKRKLGLYGKLFDSTIGMIGLAIVMFWALQEYSRPLILSERTTLWVRFPV